MYLIFLSLAFLSGFLLSCRIKKNGTFLEYTAMGIGIGYLIGGWTAYLVSYTTKTVFQFENPKFYGNAAAMILMAAITILLMLKYGIPKMNPENVRERVLFGALFLIILGSMFYVFYVKDGILYSGATVYSDYSPHTAMIRSFSYHDNFPTQYPHYGGEDVKYHFMFQFLSGNLEYLGMRIDWAFNLTSAASLWGFLVLLYHFAKQITGTGTAVITIFMFFCRSSFAAFEKIIESIQNGSFDSLLSNTTFIGYTEHEDWGLWNYNVFLNQRHLGFGLLIAAIAISWFAQYLDWLDTPKPDDQNDSLLPEQTEPLNPESQIEQPVCMPVRYAVSLFRNTFFTKNAWACRNLKIAVAMGLLLGSLAFWNGAVVIAALLILFGFAVFSKNKADFAITAAIAVCLSVLQTKFFTTDGVGISFSPGFLAESATISGIAKYLVLLAGIYFIGAPIFLILLRGKKKVMAFAFLLPVLFAFTMSMTPDITVNHKYIMIAVIFFNIFWGYALQQLFRRRWLAKTVSVLLLVTLTITGAYDLLTIYQTDKESVGVDTESKLTAWLKENVTENDLVLVNYDSMSEVTLSGVMMYNTWPYYAWSAGYDTSSRDAAANEIYEETDTEMLKEELKAAGIDYIVVENGNIDATTIAQVCECVFDDGWNQVYKVLKE